MGNWGGYGKSSVKKIILISDVTGKIFNKINFVDINQFKMRKIYISLLIFFLIQSVEKANHNASLICGDPNVRITIQWGRIPNCTGWGICGIVLGDENVFSAVQIDSLSGEYWMLVISKQDLVKYHPELISILDEKRIVTFEDSYILPPEIKKALGTSADLTIRANQIYPLTYNEGKYFIAFPF